MEGQEGMPVGFAPTVESPKRHCSAPWLGLLTACGVAILALPCRSAELISVRSEREQLYEEISVEVDALEKQGGLLKKVVRLTAPTVVHIETIKTSSVSYSRRTQEEAGSGVIVEINDKPYILTNRHVVDDASLSNINIHLADGRLLHPTNVASDRRTDVAILALDAPDVTPARLGDSGQRRNRRFRPGRRQPVRLEPLRYVRHHFREGTARSGVGRRQHQVPGLLSDGRGH